ncbi:MAG: FAD-dependent oxidoreductase [Thermoleophilia bacterium]|nr:FAD-dependent oxidoreductase [Thermoleophilia bacterium]
MPETSEGRIVGKTEGLGGTAARAGRHSPFRVVVAGGGVAALEATLALRALAAELVDVEVVAPEHHFWYRPLAVAEPFEQGRAQAFELAELTGSVGARFTPGGLARVDADARVATTTTGAEIAYDALVVASGAHPRAALAGALTFRGPADAEAFRLLLAELETGAVARLVFAVPGGVTWPLPLYELALMTAAHIRRRETPPVALALVTHESAPLAIFGEAASAAVSSLLAERDVFTFCGRYVVRAGEGEVSVVPTGSIPADRVVALPRLGGTEIEGLPTDAEGFVPTDHHGRVVGLERVWAAGDVTTFPVKQGGIAAQQADAVAQSIAAEAGADLRPDAFRPVLRGLLLTGGVPAYLRAELGGGHGDTSLAASDALWWPPGKLVGRYLAPFLAERQNVPTLVPDPPPGALSVETDLSADGFGAAVGEGPSSRKARSARVPSGC